MRVHKDAFANVALLADARIPADMRLTPDASSGADFGSRLYLGGWVNEIRRFRHQRIS
jgi:hypothetical protein